ncbi:MAG: glycosyltransferase WbuB [Porticoccaceae bacterium]
MPGNMRILIYALNFSPELIGAGKYTGELADGLADAGMSVRVVTAPPYYPQWQVQPGYSAIAYRREKRNGDTLIRCPLWVPRKPTFVKRTLHLLSFAITSFPALLVNFGWRPQVVFLVMPTIFCLPGALLFARMVGAKLWVHMQDFELEMAGGVGMRVPTWFQNLASRLERFFLRRADRVSTISNRMVDRLEEKGVAPDRRVHLPNWVNEQHIFPQSESTYRVELGLDGDQRVCLYAGNLGAKQGLDMVIEAAHFLQDKPQWVFVFAGEGPMSAAIQQAAEELRNVHWLPLQPEHRLNDLLNLADVHLLPQQRGAADLVMPSKLTGMLASGRPVIATADVGTQIEQVVSGCGVVVPPGDAVRFAKAIEALLTDPQRCADLGRSARAYAVTHLSQSAVLAQFNTQLRGMI